MDRKIYTQYLQRLRDASIKPLRQITSIKYRHADYIDAGNMRYLSEWEPYKNAAFPLTVTTLIEAEAAVPPPPENPDERIMLRVSVNGLEGLVRFGRRLLQGLDGNRVLVPLPDDILGKQDVLSLELYRSTQVGDMSGYATLGAFEFVAVNREIEKFYFDLLVAYEALEAAQSAYISEAISRGIDTVLRTFDLSCPAGELATQCKTGSAELYKALSSLPVQAEGAFSLVGHSHIDTAWLWRIADTRRKIGHTFSNILALMADYPDFVFAASQAQQYEWAKQLYPELYEAIKAQVSAGKWEPIGGMWVEPDMNIISGESVVRQLLYGCGFFEKEFGTGSSVAWMPDTFGFQGNLPQLLRLAGLDSFYTYKVNCQNKAVFPHTSFIWKGIDGSEVIAAAPDHLHGYNGDITPAYLRESQKRNKQPGVDTILPFGYGDGGGGPTREMLEHVQRLTAYPGLPGTRMETARAYFNRLRAETNLPVWTGELPVNTHRGTLTSQAFVKQYNRRCEQLLRQAEIWHTLSSVTKGLTPERGLLSDAWKDTLLLQFHDILPGSSVEAVYEECREIYPAILAKGGQVLGSAMNAIMGNQSGEGETIVVLNSLSWPHTGFVRLPVSHFEPGEYIAASRGKQSPAIVIDEPDGRILFFVAHDVPAFGTAVYTLEPVEEDTPPCAEVRETADGYYVKTARYEMRLRNDGVITSLKDRRQGREIVSGSGANHLRIYFDGPQEEDAWNLYDGYRLRPADPEWANNLMLMTNDSVYVEFMLSKSSARTVIYQAIRLYADIDRIDFKTHIDWSEQGRVLKAESGFELNAQTAYFETGFGAHARPTHKNDIFQQQQYEVAGQRWVDLSEGDYGVSILNDCKYGFDVTENAISITLLRGTDYPDRSADIGAHVMAWSILPHMGVWQTAHTARRAHEFNAPLVARCVEGEVVPFTGPAFEPSSYSIVIDTIKPCEDGTGIIMRLYESCGLRGRTALRLNLPACAVYEVGLLEDRMPDGSSPQPVPLKDGVVEISYSPFQVITLKLALAG